jgi:hypothetical protein
MLCGNWRVQSLQTKLGFEFVFFPAGTERMACDDGSVSLQKGGDVAPHADGVLTREGDPLASVTENTVTKGLGSSESDPAASASGPKSNASGAVASAEALDSSSTSDATASAKLLDITASRTPFFDEDMRLSVFRAAALAHGTKEGLVHGLTSSAPNASASTSGLELVVTEEVASESGELQDDDKPWWRARTVKDFPPLEVRKKLALRSGLWNRYRC